MMNLIQIINEADTIAIAGHTRPDGDCVGSCMGLYNYIKDNYPQKNVDVFLEPIGDRYKRIRYSENIQSDYSRIKAYDLFVSLDSADEGRLNNAAILLEKSKKTVNIDHHISNTSFAMENHVCPNGSSASEVLYDLLDETKISKAAAESLYVGIICDTGVFKFSSTSKHTMEIAGSLMEKGIDYTALIDEVFYQKTYMQNQLLGRALTEGILVLDGQCIFSLITKEMLAFYKASSNDLEGIIDQLRITKGVEVAMLITERESYQYKISLRSNNIVDVNKIASIYGGGGHIRAAGCTIAGSKYDVINNLIKEIEGQLK